MIQSHIKQKNPVAAISNRTSKEPDEISDFVKEYEESQANVEY